MLFRTADSLALRAEALWLLLGRIALGVLYVPTGYAKLMDPSRMTGMLTNKGWPVPMVFAILAGLVELLGGIAIIVGFKTRCAAIAMIVFTIIASLLAHNFWAMEGAARATNHIQFFKNLAIIGGFLFVFVRGAGPWSLDRR
jgi:putative oxidoreductase